MSTKNINKHAQPQSIDKIMKNVKKIYFPPIALEKQVVDFFFFHMQNSETMHRVSMLSQMKNYKFLVRNALEIPSIIQKYVQINEIIRNSIGNQDDGSYRDKKIKKMEEFYSMIVDSILKCIQLYYYQANVWSDKDNIYYLDAKNGKHFDHYNIYTGNTLQECIHKAFLYFIPIMQHYNQEVENEYNTDKIVQGLKKEFTN